MKLKITNNGADSRTAKSDSGNFELKPGKSVEIEFDHSVEVADEDESGGLSFENTGDKVLVATIGEVEHVIALGQTITNHGPHGAHVVEQPEPKPEPEAKE